MNTATPRKYPRTPHLPFSSGATADDKFIDAKDFENFKKLPEFVTTEKMDGGNLTFARDYFHARSLDAKAQPWDTAAKALWAQVRFLIPEGWSVSGESLYARRSVAYENLPEVFLIFGAWDENGDALSWAIVEELSERLRIPTVPVLYRGGSFELAVEAGRKLSEEVSEGFVIRNASGFLREDFGRNVVKYVRANHVRTSADWRHRDDFEKNTFRRY